MKFSTNRARLIPLSATALVLVSLLGFFGCRSGGETDGENNPDSGIGDGYVSDGGSGGTIEIEVVKDSIAVAEESGFFVRLKDPEGDPLSFVKITCNTELGLAITEPTAGYESTGADGSMSGRIGGTRPGSFVIECRAPQGYNLVARKTVKVTGEIPADFDGFPGSAGGGLGGGVSVGDAQITISGFAINDGDDETTVIDIHRDSDCDDDVDTDDPETMFYATFDIEITNTGSTTLFVDSVEFSVEQSPTVTSIVQLTACQVPAGDSAVCSGPFSEFTGATSGTNNTGKSLVGSDTSFEEGTFNVGITIEGTSEIGSDFTLTGGRALTFGAVNRGCGG